MTKEPNQFSFRFFRGLATQRRLLLASTEQTALPINHELRSVLTELGETLEYPVPKLRSRYSVLWLALRAIRSLLISSILWRAFSATVILCGVALSTRIMEGLDPLPITIGFIALFFLSKLVEALVEYFDAYRRAQVNRVAQGKLMACVNAKLADLDRDEVSKFSRGELKTLVSSDVEAIEDFLTACMQQITPALVSLCILGPVIILTAGTAGAIALAAAISVAPIAIITAKIIERLQLRAQAEQDVLTTSLGEWVRNVRLVRFLGWESFLLARFDKLMGRFTRWYALKHLLVCVVYGITFSWWMVPILAMLLYSHLTNSSLSLVQLFSSIWILDHLVMQLSYINYPLSLFGPAIAGCQRLFRLFSALPLSRHLTKTPQPSAGALSGTPHFCEIRLNAVTVNIDNRPVLGPITTRIDLRSRTAIVGIVGGGKSLLLELLVGERAPSSGTIEVMWLAPDGARHTAPLWHKEVYPRYRETVAYVPQQAYLSNTLMRFNIDLSTNADDEAVERAARRAQLTRDIASFTQGYSEEVGEAGINLSGGQRQRVNMARAFLSQRPILMLDDPLSAVDRDTEQLLAAEIFAESTQGLVLVSHRLDELERCQRVIVIADGKIAEDGRPDQLLALPGGMFQSLMSAGEALQHE